MADNIQLNEGAGGQILATEDIGGVQHELIIMEFSDGAGGATKVSAVNPLPVLASIDTTGLATSAIQTDGTQKTQIVDAGGDAVTVTGGKLDVNASIDTTGLSTSAKQDTGNTSLSSIDTKTPALGQALAAASTPVVLTSAQITTLTPPAAITGFATSAAQTDKSQFTKLTDGADTALITAAGEQNVIATAQPGVDIGDVTVNNAAGAAAVNIQDGGNSITVDGTVAIGAGSAVIGHVIADTGSTTAVTGNVTVVQGTATNLKVDASGVAVPVTDNGGSLTVDNAGTFAMQLTGATNNINNVSGTVSLPTGAATGTKQDTMITSLQLIDDIVFAEDTAHTTGDKGAFVLAVRNDGGSPLAGSDGDYVPLTTDATGALRIDMNGTLSTANSSTVVLAGNATFTGTGEDTLNYNEIRISVIASHASATDGLSIQQSSDNSNWDIIDTYTIAAATGKTFSVPRQARYFRVVYTNGATLQTSFRLQTILNREGTSVSSQRATDGYTNETDLEQQQSFLMGYNGTTWDRLRSDTTNGLDVDVTRLPALVAGAAIIGKVGIDQTTPGTTNLVALTAETTKVIGTINIAAAQTLATVTTVSTVTAVTAITNALPAGTNAIGKLAANSGVDIGDVDITSIIPGTGATNLGKAEDAVHNTADTGVFILGVANEAQSTRAADGDYIGIATDTKGNTIAIGNVAHDTADAGAPIKVGAKAITSLATTTLVSSGDRTDNQSDLDGVIIVRNSATLGDIKSERTTNTDGVSTASAVFTAVASTKNYIRAFTVYNSSATDGYLDIRDGTAGTVLWTCPLPAGGGATMASNEPLFRTSANTALAYDVSAALSTVFISVSGFQSKL